MCDEAEGEGRSQATGQRQDEINVVHAVFLEVRGRWGGEDASSFFAMFPKMPKAGRNIKRREMTF